MSFVLVAFKIFLIFDDFLFLSMSVLMFVYYRVNNILANLGDPKDCAFI